MIQNNTLQNHIDFIQKQWLSKTPFTKIARTVRALQRGLTGERKLITQTYMNTAEYLFAYLAYYWPVSYVQIQHCLQKVKDAGVKFFEPGSHVLSVLDVGSGPAPMSTCLLDFVACCYPHIKAVNLCIADISETALEIGERILNHTSYPFTLTINKLCSNTQKIFSSYARIFDIIIFGHSINELEHNNDQNDFLVFESVNNFLAQTLKPSGAVLFIEPALLATSRRLISLRNFLIEKKTISCTLPCPHALPCSVPEAGLSHTCHDEFIWNMPHLVARIAHVNALNREYIKMTWFFMLRKVRQTYNKKQQTEQYLVVSEPLLNKAGRIRYILCGSNGRIALSAGKTDAHAREIGFFELKRGNRIILEQPEQRETGYGIAQTTNITVLK